MGSQLDTSGLTKPLVKQREANPRKNANETPPPPTSPRTQALRAQNPSKASPETTPAGNFMKQASENPIMGMKKRGSQGGQVKGSPESTPGTGGSMDPFMTVNAQPYPAPDEIMGNRVISQPMPVYSPSGMQAKSPSPKGAVEAPPPPPKPTPQGKSKVEASPPPQPAPTKGAKGGTEMKPGVGGMGNMIDQEKLFAGPNLEVNRVMDQSDLANSNAMGQPYGSGQRFHPASVLKGTGGLGGLF